MECLMASQGKKEQVIKRPDLYYERRFENIVVTRFKRNR
jgi:hypothetical protein